MFERSLSTKASTVGYHLSFVRAETHRLAPLPHESSESTRPSAVAQRLNCVAEPQNGGSVPFLAADFQIEVKMERRDFGARLGSPFGRNSPGARLKDLQA